MKNLLVGLSLVLLTAQNTQAQTQVTCADRKEVIAKLSEQYGEGQLGFGMADGTAIFEIWVSDSGTWTILKTSPNGLTCVMAVGDQWNTTHKLGGKDS